MQSHEAETPVPSFSVLGASLWQRLAVALCAAGFLWLAVWWAF